MNFLCVHVERLVISCTIPDMRNQLTLKATALSFEKPILTKLKHGNFNRSLKTWSCSHKLPFHIDTGVGYHFLKENGQSFEKTSKRWSFSFLLCPHNASPNWAAAVALLLYILLWMNKTMQCPPSRSHRRRPCVAYRPLFFFFFSVFKLFSLGFFFSFLSCCTIGGLCVMLRDKGKRKSKVSFFVHVCVFKYRVGGAGRYMDVSLLFTGTSFKCRGYGCAARRRRIRGKKTIVYWYTNPPLPIHAQS